MFCVLQAPNQWTPQLVSMMLIAYARNNCVSLPACQCLLTALTNEALQQIDATDCQVIYSPYICPRVAARLAPVCFGYPRSFVRSACPCSSCHPCS